MTNETNSINNDKSKLKTSQQIINLLDGIDVMLSYATSSGKIISQDLAISLAKLNVLRAKDYLKEGKDYEESKLSELFSLAMKVHRQLSALVAPATPISLQVTERVGRTFRIRNPAMNILIYLTLFCLVGFSVTFIPFKLTGSWQQIVRSFNLLFAAGLGAGFYSLSTSRRYILQRTFDPRYNQVYYVRFVLGLAAGTILGHFGLNMTTGNLATQLGPGVLSIIGGFSADAVAQILQRLADTLVTIVRGSNQDEIEARERKVKAEAAEVRNRDRNEAVKKLQKLLPMAQGDNIDKFRKEIQHTIDELLD